MSEETLQETEQIYRAKSEAIKKYRNSPLNSFPRTLYDSEKLALIAIQEGIQSERKRILEIIKGDELREIFWEILVAYLQDHDTPETIKDIQKALRDSISKESEKT